MDYMLNLVRRHKAGEAVGIHAVCSAHPCSRRRWK
jgi:D-tagatose-1,6-bisphosphate aldolase subunit GatZ/KbaZ